MEISQTCPISYLVIDFEFTVNTQRVGRPRFFFPEIIEIGAALLDGSGLHLKKEYQAFVRPRFYPRLTEQCRNITLIRQADVDNGLTLEKMLMQLNILYQPGKTLLVAWGNSDRDVLNHNCQRYGLSYPFVWDDYINLADEYKGFYQTRRDVGLKKALEEKNIKPVGIPHSALDEIGRASCRERV